MCIACSFTRQRHFCDWKHVNLKTGYKEEVFENTLNVRVYESYDVIRMHRIRMGE